MSLERDEPGDDRDRGDPNSVPWLRDMVDEELEILFEEDEALLEQAPPSFWASWAPCRPSASCREAWRRMPMRCSRMPRPWPSSAWGPRPSRR
jgi:hypothetical protein